MALTAASSRARTGPSTGPRPDRPSAERPADLAPRLATLVVSAVFGGFHIMALAWVFHDGATPPRVLLALTAGSTLLALQLGFFSRFGTRLHSRRAYLLFGIHLLVSYLPLLYLGNAWVSLQAFCAGNALLVLPGVSRWIAWSIIVISVGVIGEQYVEPPYGVPYLIVVAAQTALIVYGLTRLRSVVYALHAMRSELARVSVAEERLRFARDVHDLLGSGLSAITLKCELAFRLAGSDPRRAQAELGHVLDISRRAMSDTRSVADGDHRLYLAEELESARSILSAADVTLSASGTDTALPEPVETVFATVLREGVTNVLRHSTATVCTIAIERTGSAATIEVVNDHPEPSDPGRTGPGGNGLGNLTGRAARLGGTLLAGPQPDGTFCLRAVVPLELTAPDRGGVRRPASADRAGTNRAHADRAHGDGRTTDAAATDRAATDRAATDGAATDRAATDGAAADGPAATARAPRPRDTMLGSPRLLVWTTFAGYFLIGALWVLGTVKGAGAMAFALTCIGAGVMLQVGYFSAPRARPRSVRSYAALAALAALTVAPILVMRNPYLGTPGFLGGSILLTLRPAVAAPALLAAMAGVAGLHAAFASDPLYVVYGAVSTGMTALVVFGLSRLITLVESAHTARKELADLAVTEQRLRFARDLHDLVGRSLSTIIVRSEAAMRLCGDAPERARTELDELLHCARRALADVRGVTAGHRDITLDSESASVRSVLAAAGIEVHIDLAAVPLPREAHAVLALVLREAAMNVLRFGEGTRCDIALRRTADGVRLEIAGDGAAVVPVEPDHEGVSDLHARLADLGGSLRVEKAPDGSFTVCADVPLCGLHDRAGMG